MRALFNESLRNYRVAGEVLDLGSKSAASSCYRYLQVAEGATVIFTDIVAKDGVLQVNVEERLPFPDGKFDFVIAFHLLEHVFDYHNCLREIARVLRPGGQVILAVPFLHMYHPDPDDYFRFSDTALVRLGGQHRLRCVSMEYIGEGLYGQALTSMVRFRRPRALSNVLQVLAYVIGTTFDRVLDTFQRRRKGPRKTIAQLHALEHLAVLQKQ